MSRSYKKYPYCGPKDKQMKKFANRKVRRRLKNLNNIYNYKAYKKVFESWDICDQKNYSTWEDYWRKCCLVTFWWNANFPEHPYELPDKKVEYKIWKKYYYYK